MNTADRSVEALDTALRRRFDFQEMLPKSELLSPAKMIWDLWWSYSDVDWNDKKFEAKERSLYELLGAKTLINLTWEEKDVLWQEMKGNGKNEDVFSGHTFEGVNLKIILENINKRLEKLLSRDHTIGHSFFLGVSSVEELYNSFYNKTFSEIMER
jgi:5-methylcytosine-specific restriction endonuclease McrBC GTP-binding regulatory subunit McrB